MRKTGAEVALTLQDGEARFQLSGDFVEASTGWCVARIPLDLLAGELGRLREGLLQLAEAGHGSFLWANEGGEVRIEVVMAKRGETHWSVRLQAAPDFLHELRLVYVGRQEELGAIGEALTMANGG